MAKCPECDCELAGMERICRDCFEKQYAVVISGKKGIRAEQFLIPSLAVAIFGIMFQLNRSFPNPMAQFGRTLHITILAGKFLLASAVVGWGIWDSLKWRSTQNLLFWTVGALQVVTAGLWLLQKEWRWGFLLVLTYALSKGISAFHERRVA
jgi:hypothetical protein